MEISVLERLRCGYVPKLPAVLRGDLRGVEVRLGAATEAVSDRLEIRKMFSHTYGAPLVGFEAAGTPANSQAEALGVQLRVGVILSGGQAPGGHNVISGLFDGLKKGNSESELIGFRNGPAGLVNGDYLLLTDDIIDSYRNTGGFDIIGSGRTKIETPEQFASSLKTAQGLGLNAVVVIGGDDSNTNAALLAEYFKKEGADISVIGVPKTIDGDLKNDYIETSFGFDTAVKTYAELVGNIMRDANSNKKYWHFIKLMGRSASHIALEVALQTQPNISIISEEVAERKTSLSELVSEVADTVQARSEAGCNFGVALIPEGLIEFIPEVKALIAELNDILAEYANYVSEIKTFEDQAEFVSSKLSDHSSKVFSMLPLGIRKQLLLDRDPHGNVQVSLIETEKLFIEMVGELLAERKALGKFSGKFSALSHFFGYEGRSAFPSNFDADYTYTLGLTAYLLIAGGFTGYMSSVQNLAQPVSEWRIGGVPITMFMNLEQRHGSMKPVIRKALVELDGAPFKKFASMREKWALSTDFCVPGAIQYYGPSEVCDATTLTLALEQAEQG